MMQWPAVLTIWVWCLQMEDANASLKREQRVVEQLRQQVSGTQDDGNREVSTQPCQGFPYLSALQMHSFWCGCHSGGSFGFSHPAF